MKVLILGDGLMGSELKKQNPEWEVLSRKQGDFNITDFSTWLPIRQADVVINCIAHTDTYDTKKDSHWLINYQFVSDLIEYCNIWDSKLVHISTDYVYANSKVRASEEDIPMHHKSWYGYTKLLSDGLVQLQSIQYLLVRCGHKPTPYPYDKATLRVLGNFDYVDVIAGLISQLILKECTGVFNVGTEEKCMHDLAIETNPDVEMQHELPVKGMPRNVTMDISKLKSHL